MHKGLHVNLFSVIYLKRFNTSVSLMSFHCSRYRTFCLEDPTPANMPISLAHTRVIYWCLLARSVVCCFELNDSRAFDVLTNFYPLFKLLLLRVFYFYFKMNCVEILCYNNAYKVSMKYNLW